MAKAEQSWKDAWAGRRRASDNEPIQHDLKPRELYKCDIPGIVTINIYWEGGNTFLMGGLQVDGFNVFHDRVLLRGVVCYDIMRGFDISKYENPFFMETPKTISKETEININDGEGLRIMEKYVMSSGMTRYRILNIWHNPDVNHRGELNFDVRADRMVTPAEEINFLRESFDPENKGHIDFRDA